MSIHIPNSRVLVVDDNENRREILVARLAKQGHAVVASSRGQQALDLIKEQKFDLVLLDFDLPAISGSEVLGSIREQYTQIELPVIALMSSTQGEDVVRALDFGANDYITTHIDSAIAMARVRTQLSLKRGDEARRESEERYSLALAGSNDGIWDWNLKTNEIRFSTRWKNALGHEEDEIGSHPTEWFERIHPDDRVRAERDIKAHLDGIGTHFENEHRILHRDGSYLWILSRGVAIRDETGVAHRIAGSQTDITAVKIADPLTGLPNRALFMDRLTRLAERAKRRGGPLFAILFLDLDRFKLINDSLGHVIGDQLLVAFVRRVQHELRSGDLITRFTAGHTLARLGGDEFTILLDDLQSASEALRVAERLAEVLKHPFNISGQEIFATASIGVSLNSTGFEKPEDLLRDADIAMYRAKANRRGSVELFDSEMRASAVARLQLETELRQAAEKKEFYNWYQSIVSLNSVQIRGFEALVRWQHPSRGLIAPRDFIPIAEETGVIVALGTQVLRKACRQIKAWNALRSTADPLVVSVNVSCRHLVHGDLLTQIKHEIQKVGIDPSWLKLEITESMVMSNPDRAKAMIRELKAFGVRIGMDDFGTGYSSFSYLHSFPLDTLKIDRSFISRIEIDGDKLEIVRTIISLAHNLGLEVIAEGIETQEQMLLLKELGCESGQGFFFSRPLDAAGATELLIANASCVATGQDRF